jgi:hypothetical protein
LSGQFWRSSNRPTDSIVGGFKASFSHIIGATIRRTPVERNKKSEMRKEVRTGLTIFRPASATPKPLVRVDSGCSKRNADEVLDFSVRNRNVFLCSGGRGS